ncbi:unnamed protein product [Peniophora sp. CBMAI 1063]|nr:unnamed protein product [Peniophora sp. CBMAI 1063]
MFATNTITTALPSWALIFIILGSILAFTATSVGLFYHLGFRRRLHYRAIFSSWTLVPIPAPSSRPTSTPTFGLESLDLVESLQSPAAAYSSPIVRKDFNLVRGARLPRTLSSYSDTPILPLQAIYTPELPGLDEPAPAKRIFHREATPPASIGLDTPPPTPVIEAPKWVEDFLRHRTEASNEFAPSSSDSTASSSCSYPSSDSSSSLTSILDAFPGPPTSVEKAQIANPIEDILPTPPPSPLVPTTDFFQPVAASKMLVPDTTSLQSTSSSGSMSTSSSDILLLGRLFGSSVSSSSSISDMVSFEKPECPALQVFTASKSPNITSPLLSASTSFYVSVGHAAEDDCLTSTSEDDLLLFGRLFTSSFPSSSTIHEMVPFEKPECPPLQVFTAHKALNIIPPPMSASISFCVSTEHVTEHNYLAPPASQLWS